MRMKQRVALWLANGETGISSKTIAFYLGFEIIPKRASYPRDVTDFRRCVQLLEEVPELKADILKMKDVCKVWRVFAENWLELERIYAKERGKGKCPETYAAIRKIVDENETGVVRFGKMTIKVGA
ncbi:hypothetical protein ACEE49_04985 [[Pasteurella] aerogenes]|nr:hypothetical protein [[Pasteurella] aerogenes]